ncbi:MAG: UDP-N-acetylmuramoyl-tripeptide--D-alanyl-D-alanine ligase [Thermodesulfobacteriota bacterium]
MEFSLLEVGSAIQAVGDFERCEGLTVSRVQTDSRLIQPGDLFVCISGERFDGHEFAREAVHKGAVAIVVERPLEDLKQDIPLLLVQDSIGALAELAIYCRNRFSGSVVAVTGTAGKTTVKEWLTASLGRTFNVGKNYKNWNNRLGVSLSILGFDGREDYWVLEAGISEENEMDELGMLIRPDMVVVNNVGSAHLQGLGDVAGVAGEKMKLLNYMQKQGKVVLNHAYSWLQEYFPGHEDPEVVFYSTRNKDIAFFGEVTRSHPGGKADYKLILQKEGIELSAWPDADFILENVLAAATAAALLGADCTDIKKGLQEAELQSHRWEILQAGPIRIIDDTYNANPVSMQSALSATLNIAGDAPVFLLLGDMKELGEYAEMEHRKLGNVISTLPVDCVFYFGSFAPEVEYGLGDAASGPEFVRISDRKEFLSQWKKRGPEKGVLLAKGSRECALENFVQALQTELEK